MCEIADSRRYERKASLNPYANLVCPNIVVSMTILVNITKDSILVSLIVSSDDKTISDKTFVPVLMANGFRITAKNE